MKLYPPLEERTDVELFDMVGDNRKWTAEASGFAYQELKRREYSDSYIAKGKREIELRIIFIEEQENVQRQKNSVEGYTPPEMLLIIIGFPFRIFFHSGALSSFWHLDKDNYKKKIKQRIILIIVAILFWTFIVLNLFL